MLAEKQSLMFQVVESLMGAYFQQDYFLLEIELCWYQFRETRKQMS